MGYIPAAHCYTMYNPMVHNMQPALVDTLTDGMSASTQLLQHASPDATLLAHPLSFTATWQLCVRQKEYNTRSVSCGGAWQLGRVANRYLDHARAKVKRKVSSPILLHLGRQ